MEDGTCHDFVPPPGGVSAVRAGSTAIVAWNSVEGAVSYDVGTASRSGAVPNILVTALTTTSFTDTEPPPAEGTWYAVRANLGPGATIWNYGRLEPVPAPPADVATKSLVHGIRVSWANTSSQSVYSILRAPTAAGPFVEIATAPGNFFDSSVSYDDLGLGTSQDLFYEVVATFFGIRGLPSEPVRGTTQGPPPPPPGNVIGSLVGDGFVAAATWTASPGALRYRVSLDGSFLETVTGTSYTAVFNRLSTDQTAVFQVVAQNDGGDSDAASSNPVTTAPGPLYGPVLAAGAMSQVNVTWTDPRLRNYPFVYRLLRGPPGGAFTEIASTTALDFTDSSTGDWITWCYEIVVDFGSGQTAPSNVACAETRGPPDQLNAGTAPLGIVQQNGDTVYGQTFAVAQTGQLVGVEISASEVIDPIRILLRFFDGDAFLLQANEQGFLNQPLTTPPVPLDRATNGLFYLDLTQLSQKIFVAAGGSLRFDLPQIFQPPFQLQFGTSSGDAYPAGAMTIDGVPVATGTDLVFKTVVRPVAENLSAPFAFPPAIGPDRVQLAWKGIAGAASYHVQRSPDGGGTFADLGNTPATALLDSGLPAGATFTYRIAPIGVSGTQGPATTVVATTQGALDAQRTNTGFLYGASAIQPFTARASGLLTGIMLRTTGAAVQVSVTDAAGTPHGPVTLFPAIPPQDLLHSFDTTPFYVDLGSLGVQVAQGDTLSFTATMLPTLSSAGIAAGADPGGGFTLGDRFVPDQAIWFQTFVH